MDQVQLHSDNEIDSRFNRDSFDRTTLISSEGEVDRAPCEKSAETTPMPSVVSQEERRRIADHRDWLGLIGFKLIKRLDTNERGQVYLAWRYSNKQPMVIKVTSSEPGQGDHHSANAKTPSSSLVSRFKLEARLLSAFGHPNLVKAFGFGRVQKVHYMLLEYVEGPNLKQLVRKQGPLPVPLAIQAIRQAAAGLAYAHGHGVIHRDVKPANMVLSPQGVLKVLDLGLARVPESINPSLTLVCQDRMLGTPDFIAPEQILNSHTVDARVDIYSLGCTLYYLLAGFVPFAGDTLMERLLMHQTAEPLALHRIRPDVSIELSNFVARMMAKRREDRFASMLAVRDALDSWSSTASSRLPECVGQ